MPGSGIRWSRISKGASNKCRRRSTVLHRVCPSFAGRVAPDLGSLPPDDATTQLNRRLEEAKQAARHREVRLAERERTGHRVKT